MKGLMAKRSLAMRVSIYVFLICVVLSVIMGVCIARDDYEELYSAIKTDSYEVLPVESYRTVEDAQAPLGFYNEYTWDSFSVDNMQEECISFYTIHHYVEVYLDGRLMLSINERDGAHIAHGISGRWVYVPLLPKEGGSQLKVITKPIYENVVHRQPQFYLGSPTALFYNVRMADAGKTFVSVLAIAMGVCGMILWLGLRIVKKRDYDFIKYLGLMLILLGICRITSISSTSILFPFSNYVLSYVSNFALILAWIAFHFFVERRFSDYRGRLIKISYLVCAFTSLFLLSMQALGLAELRNLRWLMHIGMLFNLAVVGIVSYSRVRKVNDSYSKMNFVFGMLLTAGVVADIAIFYISSVSRSLFFTIIVCLVYSAYVAIQYMVLLNINAHYDIMTGLYNRSFWEMFTKEFDRNRQDCGLMAMDINGLKRVNDTLGHLVGDKMLIDFAELLKSIIPTGGGRIYRMGGDEFVMVIPNASPELMDYTKKSLDKQLEMYNGNPENIPISYGSGVVFSNDYPGKSMRELMKLVDERLYEDKQSN